MRLELRAPAKLNLAFEVLGRRSDGFHEVRGVLQTIGLYDRVAVEPAAELRLEAPEAAGPLEANLALRAARLLADRAGSREGARIALSKEIPVSAGLGGGSADAAATLRLLDRLWKTGLGPARVTELAAELGSDVPFLVRGGTGEVRGRGEQVAALPALASCWLVLVCPPWQLVDKTVRVYRAVESVDFSDGSATERLVTRLRAGGQPGQAELVNGLAAAAERVFPELGRLRWELVAASGVGFGLSGAGPSLFHLASGVEAAREVARRVGDLGGGARLVRTVGRVPRIGVRGALSAAPRS